MAGADLRRQEDCHRTAGVPGQSVSVLLQVHPPNPAASAVPSRDPAIVLLIQKDAAAVRAAEPGASSRRPSWPMARKSGWFSFRPRRPLYS